MKYSLNWIQKYTHLPKDLPSFLEKMAIDGFETEGIEVFDLDENIVVARIDSIKKHPNADKLNLCQVAVESHKYSIVCGANNLYPDMMVALARVGSKLPAGLKIKKSKIRDVVSEGMLCSASELGLSDDSEGILDLNKDLFAPKIPVEEGVLVAEVLGMPDKVIDFNITPNRGYCLSHSALAQEIAVLNAQKYQALKQNKLQPEINKSFKAIVKTDAQKSCPKYLARYIEAIKPNQLTPAYISSSLKKCGLNCINPVVDILNYVMLEIGQPMHAFDADKIQGNITVRYSNSSDSKIKLINQDLVEIKKNTLLICDESSVVALAGVMGSLDSAVEQTSTNILLECAYFDATEIAGKARAYNLNSDAAYRYERNVDFNLPEIAIERATDLIIKHLSGKASKVFSTMSQSDNGKSNLAKLKPIELSFEKVNKVLGLNLKPREIVEMLSRICDVEYSDTTLTFTPPSHRFDLRIEEDLIEEIVRIYGYQKINTNQVKVASSKFSAHQFNSKRIRDFWVDRGYNEVINYSFISPKYHQLLHPTIKAIELENPISQDKSVMRYSLLSGLIDSYLQNQKYQNLQNRFFEIGSCFSSSEDNLFNQSQEIAGLIAGPRFNRNWNHSKREVDFYDLKGDLEALFQLSGSEIKFKAQNKLDSLHPNQSAQLVLESENSHQIIGYVGYLHPKLLKKLDINQEILIFEFDLEKVISKPTLKFTPFSRLPQVKRDLAFLVTRDITSNQISQSIDALKIKDLKSHQIFDVYQDPKLDQKSIAVEFCFQSDKKTLRDEAIEFMLQKIIEQLKADLSVKFRDF